jgi:CBS domain-containing protein
MDLEVWTHHSFLPVVDFEGKPFGYLTRSDLVKAIGLNHEKNLLLDSGMELTARFFQFLAYMLGLVLSRGSK